MPLSELEAHAHRTDLQIRAVLLDLLRHKKEAQRQLQDENLSVLAEQRLESYIAEVDSQIQQYRFSGTF